MSEPLGQCGYVDRPGEEDAFVCPEPATQKFFDPVEGVQRVFCDEHAEGWQAARQGAG